MEYRKPAACQSFWWPFWDGENCDPFNGDLQRLGDERVTNQITWWRDYGEIKKHVFLMVLNMNENHRFSRDDSRGWFVALVGAFFWPFSQRPLFFAKVPILSKEFKGAPLRVGGGSFKMARSKMARSTRNKGLVSELVVSHLKNLLGISSLSTNLISRFIEIKIRI